MDRVKIVSQALKMLGKPYLLGAKWDINVPNPCGSIDCSGFVRWAYFQGGMEIVDGSYNQYAHSVPASDPLPGDLGFFKNAQGIHHVGMIADSENMIEARGAPYNAVILRPRSKWEAWPEFTGYMKYAL